MVKHKAWCAPDSLMCVCMILCVYVKGVGEEKCSACLRLTDVNKVYSVIIAK